MIKQLKIKQIPLIIIFLLLCNICFAQQIISYQNDERPSLNITLNGKVKYLKQVSYSPDILCDTIPIIVDTIHSRGLVALLCITDTSIYFFNENSLPEQIKKISCDVDKYNRKSYSNIYDFDNGNLVSETIISSGTRLDDIIKTTYKYDQNNNMILETVQYSLGIFEDFLEYDNNNNLIKKYHYKRQFRQNPKPVLLYTEEYKYDLLGHLISEVKIDNEKKIEKKIYVYDTNGNKIEEGGCANYKGKKCKSEPSRGFVYDENNRMIKSFLIGKWYPHNTDTYYQYDEQGRKIEVKEYYIRKDTVLGYHYICEYNEKGQQIMEEVKTGRELYIDMDISCKKIITMYDDYGNITQEEYYMCGTQDLLIVRYIYTYDFFGNWIKKEKYEGKNEEELSKSQIYERIIEYYD